jgi:ATP-binding cassette subfamily F protein uup
MPERQLEIAALVKARADSALFADDPAEFNMKAARLAAAQSEIETYEQEWLALEEKRETLARG